MGKLSLKAKNPFGSDIEIFSTKTWIGLGAAALVVSIFGAMVIMAKSVTKRASKGIGALHARLEAVG